MFLVLVVLAKPAIGYQHTRRNPTARWVSQQVRQEHRHHVAGIRGGAASRVDSTEGALDGLDVDMVSSAPGGTDTSSRTPADPADRVRTPPNCHDVQLARIQISVVLLVIPLSCVTSMYMAKGM